MMDDDPPVPPAPVVGFWTWLVRKDKDGDLGLENILNRWVFFHIALGLALGFVVSVDPRALAQTVALPGAAILVGLAFGWAGRSAGLLQDKSFSQFLIENGPSPEGYVYAFQLSVLCVLTFIATAFMLIAGGTPLTTGNPNADACINRFALGFVGSLAVREGWGIIYFVNKLTIQYYRVRERELEQTPPQTRPLGNPSRRPKRAHNPGTQPPKNFLKYRKMKKKL